MPRPRTHAPGTNRATVATRRLVAAGGRRITVCLSPAATQDLAALRQAHATDTAAIEAALRAASRPEPAE